MWFLGGGGGGRGSGFDPRVFFVFFFSWGWSTFCFAESEIHFLKWITCTFCRMPYTITSTVFFGAIIVGLSGGWGGYGGEERVPSQIRNVMVWIYMGSNLSWRGVWGSSPQENLEIWSAQRVILGLLRAQSQIRNLWCEYLWVAGCLGVLPQENLEIWSAQGVILGLQSQIRKFMVWIYMGSNLSWRGVWGSSPQENLEIWSAQRVILGLLRAQSQIRNFMVWIFMGSGVFGGPPPRKFRNMKCSRSNSRPILGFGFVNGGFEIL